MKSCTEAHFVTWHWPGVLERLQILVHRNFKLWHFFEYFFFPAHCALHTTDRFQTIVFFRFVFSVYTEPLPVNTEHYFFLCALNLQILPCHNVMWKGKKHRCDDSWICFNTVKSVVPYSLSQCNSNYCYSAGKKQSILFKIKGYLIFSVNVCTHNHSLFYRSVQQTF